MGSSLNLDALRIPFHASKASLPSPNHLPLSHFKPFQVHFKSISSPFQVHFKSISSPFQVHFKSILSRLKPPCRLFRVAAPWPQVPFGPQRRLPLAHQAHPPRVPVLAGEVEAADAEALRELRGLAPGLGAQQRPHLRSSGAHVGCI